MNNKTLLLISLLAGGLLVAPWVFAYTPSDAELVHYTEVLNQHGDEGVTYNCESDPSACGAFLEDASSQELAVVAHGLLEEGVSATTVENTCGGDAVVAAAQEIVPALLTAGVTAEELTHGEIIPTNVAEAEKIETGLVRAVEEVQDVKGVASTLLTTLVEAVRDSVADAGVAVAAVTAAQEQGIDPRALANQWDIFTTQNFGLALVGGQEIDAATMREMVDRFASATGVDFDFNRDHFASLGDQFDESGAVAQGLFVYNTTVVPGFTGDIKEMEERHGAFMDLKSPDDVLSFMGQYEGSRAPTPDEVQQILAAAQTAREHEGEYFHEDFEDMKDFVYTQPPMLIGGVGGTGVPPLPMPVVGIDDGSVYPYPMGVPPDRFGAPTLGGLGGFDFGAFDTSKFDTSGFVFTPTHETLGGAHATYEAQHGVGTFTPEMEAGFAAYQQGVPFMMGAPTGMTAPMGTAPTGMTMPTGMTGPMMTGDHSMYSFPGATYSYSSTGDVGTYSGGTAPTMMDPGMAAPMSGGHMEYSAPPASLYNLYRQYYRPYYRY